MKDDVDDLNMLCAGVTLGKEAVAKHSTAVSVLSHSNAQPHARATTRLVRLDRDWNLSFSERGQQRAAELWKAKAADIPTTIIACDLSSHLALQTHPLLAEAVTTRSGV